MPSGGRSIYNKSICLLRSYLKRGDCTLSGPYGHSFSCFEDWLSTQTTLHVEHLLKLFMTVIHCVVYTTWRAFRWLQDYDPVTSISRTAIHPNQHEKQFLICNRCDIVALRQYVTNVYLLSRGRYYILVFRQGHLSMSPFLQELF